MYKPLVLLSCLALACSASAVTLHVHNGGDPTSLDPHKISGDWENRVVGDAFEGLMTEDEFARATYGMASSHSVSTDGLTYTFQLRSAKWSDGNDVSADDFVYAFRRLMQPTTAAKYAWLQFPIKNAEAINSGAISDVSQLGVRAVSSSVLEIELEEATPYFLGALTHYTAYPVPSWVIEQHGDEWVKVENIVVNGPYKPTEWIPGSHVALEKNPSYYDYANLAIDEVIFYVLEDQSAALKRYEAGEFDILTAFPKDQIERLRRERPDELQLAPYAGLYYYVVNHNMPELQNKRIRQAMAMAINRNIITEKILGTGEQPAYSIVPPNMDNYGDPFVASWAQADYTDRVQVAKDIMAIYGYDRDNPLKLVLRYNTNDNHKRVAVAIAAMWKAIGIEIELLNTEVKVHYEDLNKNQFEVARAGWLADYNDPINFLSLLRNNTEYNYGRWDNARFNELVNTAEQTLDLGTRAQWLLAAEQLAVDEVAMIPIYYYMSENIVSTAVKGYQDNAFDIHRTRYLSKSE